MPDLDRLLGPMIPVLDAFYEGVTVTDDQGVIVYYNNQQAKIDDIAPDDALGRSVTALYRVDEGQSPTMTCIQTQRPVVGLACYYRTHLGRVVNSIHNIYPLYSGRRLVGAICFITDFRLVEQRYGTVLPSPAVRDRSGIVRRAKDKKRRRNGTRFSFADIVGVDEGFVQAVQAAKMGAQSPSPILIYGETGTGKELFAQAVHNRGPRADAQFVAVNCSAIPENLLEGMLFGTAKGAFTGALSKPGLFEQASGGTLFLDELNAMPRGLQSKLLRVVQENRVRRVGSLTEKTIDLKIISSVSVEPHHAIDQGQLRPDLYYRLGVVQIQIPPLRHRREDLSLLIGHFIHKCNSLLNKRVDAISDGVMAVFRRHLWPGNVRELEHVIEGAMNLIMEQSKITTAQLPEHLARYVGAADPSATEAPSGQQLAAAGGRTNGFLFLDPKRATGHLNVNLSELTARHESELLRIALLETGGNGAKAARLLGISPQLLHYKLKKHRIDRQAFRAD